MESDTISLLNLSHHVLNALKEFIPKLMEIYLALSFKSNELIGIYFISYIETIKLPLFITIDILSFFFCSRINARIWI